MDISLIKLEQADQLSACKLSQLLGLNSENDQIKRFFKFGQKLSLMGAAMVCFHEEPYFWHYQSDLLHGLQRITSRDHSQFFEDAAYIDEQHTAFSAYIASLGINSQRLFAVDLKKENQESIGMALFFDEETEQLNTETKDLLMEHCADFARYIELKASHDLLNEQYEQQAALNFSKTKFLSIISHDLRAPFHGLLGFTEVLAKERETLDEASVQNIVDYLYETSQSTYNLLESLLKWAMADGGRFAYHPVNFNVRHVTSTVLKVLNTLAINKNIQLIDEVPEQLNVYADINMITSVIQNLVSNALKFTQVDGTGKVYVQAVKKETGVEIYVRDTGLGMTQQQINNIFQPHLTVSFKGTSGEKGAGLGLTLCKRFIDLNHGEISVNSTEGEGSVFKIVLPTVVSQTQILEAQKNSNELKFA